MEQSHWLASNAVLSNGKVMSITDESGTANAIAVSNARDAYPWTYAASGWQLNGKTLPTMYVSPSDWCIYRADAWADKLSNYTGSYTVAMLVEPKLSVNNTSLYSAWGTSSGQYMLGPYHNTYEANWRTQRLGNGLQRVFASGGKSDQKQLFIAEFTGTGVNAAAQWKFWIDGNSRAAYADGWYDVSGAISADRFSILGDAVGGSWKYWGNGTQMAQFHIWKGALTTEQRDNVTAYLKSISGIA